MSLLVGLGAALAYRFLSWLKAGYVLGFAPVWVEAFGFLTATLAFLAWVNVLFLDLGQQVAEKGIGVVVLFLAWTMAILFICFAGEGHKT